MYEGGSISLLVFFLWRHCKLQQKSKIYSWNPHSFFISPHSSPAHWNICPTVTQVFVCQCHKTRSADWSHRRTAVLSSSSQRKFWLVSSGARISVNHSVPSPDCMESDFHLFGYTPDLAGQTFRCDEELKTAVCLWLHSQQNTFMTLAYKNLCHGGTNVSMCRAAMWRYKERVWLSNVYLTLSLWLTVPSQKIYWKTYWTALVP